MGFTVTKYPHGTFCWADCNATDPAKAKAFYTAVMGWTAQDLPISDDQVYTMFQQDGHDIVGLGPQQPGMPSVWNHYIAVEDVDALMDKVRALGGTVVVEPFDVMSSGRMAVIQDPSGAHVALWQAYGHIGSKLVNIAGAVTWNELNTREPDKAQAFFSELLGWTFEDDRMAGYRMFFVNGRVNGGILQMNEVQGDMPPHWMLYFSVKDIHATHQQVLDSGGKVHTGIMNADGVGPFFVFEDPTGAVATAIEVSEPQPWDE